MDTEVVTPQQLMVLKALRMVEASKQEVRNRVHKIHLEELQEYAIIVSGSHDR